METKDERLNLKNQLCFPLYLCSKEIIKKYETILKELNLTYTQYIVMMYFWEKKISNVKEISNTLLLDSSTLSPLLKKLETKGFITRTKNIHDERNLLIKITQKGLKLKNKALIVPGKIGECLNLTEEDAITLYTLLYKILKNIMRKEEKNDKSNQR